MGPSVNPGLQDPETAAADHITIVEASNESVQKGHSNTGATQPFEAVTGMMIFVESGGTALSPS